MFESIKYLNSTYDNNTQLYNFNYEITDSDFISTSSGVGAAAAWAMAAAAVAEVVIKEYESRNYSHQEIISNLFLLNMFMLKRNWYNNMNLILEYQHKYSNKKYYPESNFNEKYYDNLVKYIKKMMVIA